MKHVLITLSIILFSYSALSGDWSSCASKLKQIKRDSCDAADYAETANSRKNDLDSAKDDLEDCLSDPDTYDYYGDKCQTQRWDYDSALSDYQSALSDYQSALSDSTNQQYLSLKALYLQFLLV